MAGDAEAQPFIKRKPLSGDQTTGPQPDHNSHSSAPPEAASTRSGSGSGSEKPKQTAVVADAQPKGAKTQSIAKAWVWEAASYLLALAALVAIIVTLKTQDRKPLPKWPRLITINSLVSVFTSILKASMIMPIAEGIGELKWLWFSQPRLLNDMDHFDEASRGPEGSLKLLFRLPKALLPCLGAAITICALAIDPFTQQIIQYYSCLEPGNDLAQIRRSNNYTLAGVNANDYQYDLDGPMTATLYEGLLNPPANATSSISTLCPTGNCTFSHSDGITYHSIAMCVEITDISNKIKGPSGESSDSLDWTYTLPSGLTTGGPQDSGVVMTTITVPTTGGSIADSLDLPLFEFQALVLNFTGASGDDVPPAWAYNAKLHPCIKAYGSSKIVKSVLKEDVVSSVHLPFVSETEQNAYFSLAGNFPARADVDCSAVKTPQGKKTVRTYTASNGQHILDNYEYGRNAPHQYYDPACTYQFGAGPTDAIPPILEGFFGEKWSESSSIYAQPQPNNLTWEGYGQYTVNGDIWLQNLYANGTSNLSSVMKTMQGLANAMTAAMRSRGEGDAAEGTAYVTQTCVRVEWGWLALDATLVVLTFVFLAATVWQSRRAMGAGSSTAGRVRGAWKSSSLPLLWSGLDEEVKRKLESFYTIDEMEELGRSLHLRLERRTDQMGLHLQVDEK